MKALRFVGPAGQVADVSLRISVSPQNNLLIHALSEGGCDSLAALCRTVNTDYRVADNLLNFRISPFVKDTGEYCSACKKISEGLGYHASEIFPRELYEQMVGDSAAREPFGIEISSSRFRPLAEVSRNHFLTGPEADPENRASRAEFLELARKLCLVRGGNLWTVLCYRYCLGSVRRALSLKEIGKRLGVSRERVRQIEAEALSMLLRHLPKVYDLSF